MQKNILISTFVFLLFVFAGCSDKVKVSGFVKFPDGEPVKYGKVNFRTTDRTYFGRIDANGYYTPGELKDGEGLPAGTYTVWLTDTVLSEPIPGKDGEETVRYKETKLVADKHTKPGPDALTFEVKRGGAVNFDITVEKP
jgi:hypothetical protein